MKTFVTFGALGCATLALIFMTTTVAADKALDAVDDTSEPRVTVQTDIKFTRKRPNGETEVIASPCVRSLVGHPAVVEMTMPNGETLTVNIGTKIVPHDNKQALPANKSGDVQ